MDPVKKLTRFISIAQFDDGRWEIDETTYDFSTGAESSSFPTTTKPDARSAAARLLQLLDLGPVAPQTEPERVGLEP